MSTQQPKRPVVTPKITPAHPELAAQPGEPVPRTHQTPAQAEEIGRKAEQHNKNKPQS